MAGRRGDEVLKRSMKKGQLPLAVLLNKRSAPRTTIPGTLNRRINQRHGGVPDLFGGSTVVKGVGGGVGGGAGAGAGAGKGDGEGGSC